MTEPARVWITHPKLTPAHDQKILREALGTYVGSGWQEREDQNDPVPEIDTAPAPAEDSPRPTMSTRTSSTKNPKGDL